MNTKTETQLVNQLLIDVLTDDGKPLDGKHIAGPACYALRYAGDFPLYLEAGLSGSRFPIYCGSTRSAAERVATHSRNLGRADGLRPTDFSVVIIPMPSREAALYSEHLLIRELQTVWNTVLTGFGSAGQGTARAHQRPPAWAIIHPGRVVGDGEPLVCRAELRRRTKLHLQRTVSVWAPHLPSHEEDRGSL